MTGIESGKVFKCLQKYIIRIAKNQRQFLKLFSKMLSKGHVTGIESEKVLKSMQKYILQFAKKKQGQSQKLCLKM